MPPDTTVALLDTTTSFFLTQKETLDVLGKVLGIIGGGGLIGLLTLFFTKTLPWWRTRRDRRLLENNLDGSLYSKAVIERSTQHYVDPFCQVVDPAGAEEPRHLAFNPKDNLFKVVDEALAQSTAHRYLILLADSGMGKTSFLLNYFARYLRKGKRGFALQLVPLGIPDADARIATIAKKEKTVLLLDALDEDTLAIVDHAARLRDLVKLTRDFQKVLITCRTQFFPKEEEIPRETGIVKVGPRAAGETAQYLFHKLYLSPFTDEQVEAYLKKRYAFWQRRRRKLADAMVQKIPNLSVRPMLLAHVEDLVRADRAVNYSFELYEEMVEAWLEREEGIFSNLKKESLRQFSERLAVDLHLNRKRRGAVRIPRAELAVLAQAWNIPLEEWLLSGRSLLNRDAEGNYKFAHRVIMEYLIVKRFIAGDPACYDMQWTDHMKELLWEIIQYRLAANEPINFDVKKADLSGLQLSLRSVPVASLTDEEVRLMLKRQGFFDKSVHRDGAGIRHLFERTERKDGKLVVDHTTGLTWQQAGSTTGTSFHDAERYIRDLNQRNFAGYSDWRLPTLEEAMSLMEPSKRGDLYLNPVFDRRQSGIWTVDKFNRDEAWSVYFALGVCNRNPVSNTSFVRAVR
ncbi:DUF1566 domain-containing protein [candidate division KSB1 bacterium]|nr:DUF1566 domain-containing protein [candidate division KSB1 bacterium]